MSGEDNYREGKCRGANIRGGGLANVVDSCKCNQRNDTIIKKNYIFGTLNSEIVEESDFSDNASCNSTYVNEGQSFIVLCVIVYYVD